MSAAQSDPDAQGSLFEVEATRTLLDALLTDSRLYHKTADYKALLDFVVRLRNFAPFNASSSLTATARQALDTAPALAGLRDAHRANLAAHRARHGF